MVHLLFLHPVVECMQDRALKNVPSVSSDEVFDQLVTDGYSELMRDWVVTLKQMIERFRHGTVMA